MKIYVAHSKHFMGYTLMGDHDKEYNTKVVKLTDNAYEECIQMALFYKLINKPIFTKISPSIYMYFGVNKFSNELTSLDYYNIKDSATKNKFFQKYSRMTGQTLQFIPLKEYTDKDNEILANLYSQFDIRERNFAILNNKLYQSQSL